MTVNYSGWVSPFNVYFQTTAFTGFSTLTFNGWLLSPLLSLPQQNWMKYVQFLVGWFGTDKSNNCFWIPSWWCMNDRFTESFHGYHLCISDNSTLLDRENWCYAFGVDVNLNVILSCIDSGNFSYFPMYDGNTYIRLSRTHSLRVLFVYPGRPLLVSFFIVKFMELIFLMSTMYDNFITVYNPHYWL